MILQFKRDSYKWGDRFYIYNNENQRVYKVTNSILLWKRKFEIKDLDGNVLITIKNEPKSLVKKKFYIEVPGHETVAITREISLIPKYTFEGLDWTMNGLMLHEYDMIDPTGLTRLSLHEESTPFGHRPVLNIPYDTDALLALGVALTISYVIPAEDGGSTSYV
ncbi:MAG: LURP-one-related family protein [Lachnospiraceae bacterium]|nr:LURP-one-related family protein [Lachnospiraceae bacterium]